MTYLMLYSLTEAGLRLSPETREAFADEVLASVFSRYADSIKVRRFDREAFFASVSDFALFETEALRSFYFSRELRDTGFYSEFFIKLGDIIASVEDGFRAFEDARRKGKSA